MAREANQRLVRDSICSDNNKRLAIKDSIHMKITITLSGAEKAGIISYLKEVEEITDKSTEKGIDFAIDLEVKNRMAHALRDPREAISDHVLEAEKAQEREG